MAARGPKMADGVWKGVFPLVWEHSRQLSLNKFFDRSTPSIRKVDDGKRKKNEKKRLMRIVATTSLPAVDRPNDDRCNVARSCQNPNSHGIKFLSNFTLNLETQPNFSWTEHELTLFFPLSQLTTTTRTPIKIY